MVSVGCSSFADEPKAVVYYKYRMEVDLVPLSLADQGLLSGMFLAACRSLSSQHPQKQMFDELALRYKLVCLRALSDSISANSSFLSDMAIVRVIQLATDDVRLS